jgi:multidrug efflux pump subunit AcrA (membrane-fusion protein)
MNRNHNVLLILIPIVLLLLFACSATPQETSTPEPLVEDFTPVVSATGKIVPEQVATLSVQSGGIVAEVLVRQGEAVEAGQLLVRLEGEERLQASLSAAQFELTSAQHALDALYKDTDLLAAQALEAKEESEKALEDLRTPELQQAMALKAIADAEKAVERTERRLRTLQSSAGQADIDAAKAQVVLARDALDKAEEDYEPYANKPEDNLVRANYLSRLSAAQKTYDAAVRKLNALQGTGSQVDIAVAQADLATAEAQSIEAQREWERVQDGPSEADVALLEAQIAKAGRDYQTYRDGPDPDDVALAEARLDNAQSQLSSAQAALEDLELRAPFSGTISDLFIHSSEWVAPGQPVLQLADLGNLQVETTDLNEIDVAQISEEDRTVVTFDALPDVEVAGWVVRIAPKAAEGAGVNYTVSLELESIPPQLRWGMTAFVDIQIDE